MPPPKDPEKRALWIEKKRASGRRQAHPTPTLETRFKRANTQTGGNGWGVDRGSVLSLEWKAAVKKRDNYTCQHCGINENLDAHHIKDWDNFPELRYVLENGITLCRSCHITEEQRILKLNSERFESSRKKKSEVQLASWQRRKQNTTYMETLRNNVSRAAVRGWETRRQNLLKGR